jgi:diguanylate cyclase (GGDEF)-like protein
MGVEMISYVIPIFINDEVIGVVGMDIDTSLLYDNTKAVKVYDKGYAFLMDQEGQFVYHPEMENQFGTDEFDLQHTYLYEKASLSAETHSVEEYHWNGIDKYMFAQKLRNGMIFTVSVEKREVKEPQQSMMIHSVVMIILMLALFFTIAVSLTNAIVRMMYTDSMVRVANKTAYTEVVDKIYKRMREKERLNFMVAVADINDLKKVNDTYGHEYGDKLIKNAAFILKKVWGKRSVFRIGGDEFAIILFDIDKAAAEEKKHLFDEELKDFNQKNKEEPLYLQMAIGVAVYDPETDRDYMEVFRRADEEMYIDKKEKKKRNF